MNIWNLSSGKHMRVYKNDLITSELYKCDIDPSGMYVSACAFDKSISLLDFFSGDVIAQVTGHSELITGIRFSPDGRWLISIGGDGCMLVWKVSDILVKTMQERLVELYTTAQNKQNKVILKQTQHLYNVVIDQPNIPSNSNESTNPNKNNPWKSRVVESGGNYEIFGRKVSIAKINDLNKFSTLELTSTVAPITNDVVDYSSNDHPNQSLANTIEELDSVMMSGLSDDDSDDGSKLFPNLPIPSPDKTNNTNPTKSNDESEYWDDFDEDNSRIIESVNKVDVLEKSASNLENWLENMLRNEGTLDTTITNKSTDSTTNTPNHEAISKNDLNKSLSSTFFSNLRNVKPIDQTEIKSKSKAEDKVPGNALEGKRRETAAAVAQMKEKLRAMGILGSSIVKTNITNQINIDSKNSNIPSDDVMSSPLPPPPVYKVSESSLNEDNVMLYPPDPPTLQEIHSSEVINCDESNDINETQSKLKSLADTCRQSLRELEVAKVKAFDNIKQYLSLQSSLDQSVFSPVNQTNQSIDIRQSISIETESLLFDFRRSIESMNELSHPIVNQSNSFTKHLSSASLDSSSQLSITSVELNHILEKYSNQLVDLVSDKIVKKIQRQT
eukprot:CAMPEP_0196764336 /NCGR_PEP_ID=MMETSP1095-20130614/5898_1 /TAXON_ID=96789 ORGANISM="Chromulina nebulosa, Strain UTEXLB2642" /NCGR_SAMPLE_ID=MMETSP1095 /ASSEMBLY_ACC=CAM_ASM_000446 /LENGTH=613 /DNA_ID=CAMNT_0042119629 /DNA_START=1865 /DNA_END=3706 /DNA_ORIENTATION=+